MPQVGPWTGPDVDPDERDVDTGPEWEVEVVRRFVDKHLPHLDATEPSIIEPCIYTVSGIK
jgi:hypothetical protein